MSRPKVGYNFVAMPREIWDANIQLSLPEFRVLGYILSYARIGKALPNFSYDELIAGKWTVREGQRQRKDQGCGVSRNGIKEALRSLEERGWIEVSRNPSGPNNSSLTIRLLLAPEEDDEEVSHGDTYLSHGDTYLSHGDTSPVTRRHLTCHGVTGKPPANKEAEVSRKEVEERAQKEEPIALARDPGLALVPSSIVQPVNQPPPDIGLLAAQIVCAHPKSLEKQLVPLDVGYADLTAAMEAVDAEAKRADCAPEIAGRMILAVLEQIARIVPRHEWRFLKRPSEFFREKEYRRAPESFSRMQPQSSQGELSYADRDHQREEERIRQLRGRRANRG